MADLTSSTELVERSKFRVPSLLLLLGQSSSGKTYLSHHLLCHWDSFFAQPFDKLTVFFSAEQHLLSSQLRSSLPSYVELVKHEQLRPELLHPERLKSRAADGLACVLLDDKVSLRSTIVSTNIRM